MWSNYTLGVPVPLDKHRLTLMGWTWHGTNPDIVHTMFKRENLSRAITPVDYVTGCGVTLTVDMLPLRDRQQARPVTCLRCVVAEINAAVIPGE